MGEEVVDSAVKKAPILIKLTTCVFVRIDKYLPPNSMFVSTPQVISSAVFAKITYSLTNLPASVCKVSHHKCRLLKEFYCL
jgi:hypothetical protein